MNNLNTNKKIVTKAVEKYKNTGLDFSKSKLLNSNENIENNIGEITEIGEIFETQLMLDDSLGELSPTTHEEFYWYVRKNVSTLKWYDLINTINSYEEETGVKLPVSADDFFNYGEWYIKQFQKINLKVLWYILKLVNPLTIYETNCLLTKIGFSLQEEISKGKQTLKEFRIAKGMTQKEVALSLGVAEASYNRYEVGDRIPSYDLGLKLCSILDIPEKDFMNIMSENKVGDNHA